MLIDEIKQLVDKGHMAPVIARLLGRQAASLSDWYGDPVSDDMAQRLEAIVQCELRTRLCAGGSCFQLHVLSLICRFWSGNSIRLEYQQLAASSGDQRECALLELVYGQLLMSCKYREAAKHLHRGFSLAAAFLDAPGYFRINRQNELFDYLPVSSTPSPPLGLASLLTEAGVIRRLQAGVGSRYHSTHHDTIG